MGDIGAPVCLAFVLILSLFLASHRVMLNSLRTFQILLSHVILGLLHFRALCESLRVVAHRVTSCVPLILCLIVYDQSISSVLS